MKKINLNQLSMSWNEKQMPQKFRRYAGMLIMLLTLGVGQMWGAAKQRYIYIGLSSNYHTYKDASTWGINFSKNDASYQLLQPTYISETYNDGSRDYYMYRVQVSDDKNQAEFKGNNDWWRSKSSVTLNGTTNNAIFFSSTSDGWEGCFQGNYQVTSTASLSATSTSMAIGSTSTLTPSLSSNATYNEIKSTSYEVSTNPNSGGSVTSAGVFSATKAGTYTVTATVTYNAKDFSGITKTATATKNITVYATVTFDKEGGSSGTNSQNATYNATTSNIIAPSKDYHDFGGYWTGDDGTGTMVINASGVWQKNISNFTDNSSTPKWIILTDQTLHAKWTPKNYSITYKDQGDVTYSGSNGASLPTSYTYGTGIASLTDGVKSGYRFDGWFTTSACTGDPVTSVSSSDNGAKVFYAKWTENPGGTITLTAGTGGQVSKDGSSWGASKSYTGIKTTDALNIYAQASAGYTFSSWSKTSGSGTITNTGLASTTFTPVANADAALTASFTENKVTLTPTVSYDHGSSTYTASSSNTVGVTTTTNLSCSEPNAAHYTFAGWTLTNLTVTSGNASTDRSITVKITTPGSAIAAVANYNEVLTTEWVLKGGTAFGDNWVTEHAFTKKSGESTGNVAYLSKSITVTPDGDQDSYNFKIVHKGSPDSYFGLDATGDEYWWLRTTGEQTLKDSKNLQLRADITGTYVFKVDFSTPASPKLTVTYPTTYTLTYDIGTVKGTSGSITTSPSTASGSKVVSGSTITLTGPAAKSGYTWKGWYTNAAGTEGKITDTDRAISVTMNADKTLYACYTENNYTVTVSAGAGGSVASTSVTGHKDTKVTLPTATPNVGYVFTGWTVTSGTASLTDASSASAAQINGMTAAVTVTANFAAATAFIEGRFHVTNPSRDGTWTNTFSEGDWDENSKAIKFTWDGTNSRYYLHTYATPKELTTQISSQNPVFYIKESSSSSSLANVASYWSATSQTLTAAGTGNKKSLVSSGTFHNDNLRFNSSDESGYTIIYFDEAGIWYELEQTLSYNGNGSTGGSAPAGTVYYNKGTNATAASNTYSKTNYTFAGWNTEEYITGTDYAASASVTMNSNITLFAKWTRSVTLNANGGSSGSTSVTATYNCATLPSITNPSKTGYTFGGWNTANDGSGDIVIASDGTLRPITGWCSSGPRFTRTASDATLYAKWTQTITLNANTDYHGSGSNTTATVMLNATALSSISHCTPATGYQRTGYYTAATGGTKVLNADGSFADSNVTDYISSSKWIKAGATTLYAQYEPITYTITLNHGTGGSGSGTATVDYDATGYKTWSHDITQTGYHINGWYDNSASLKVLDADGTFAGSSISGYITSSKWTKAADCELQAWWDPNNYTVTLDQQASADGYSASGTVGDQSVYYNTALPSITGTAPTAINGWAFMGFYSSTGGEGVQVIDGSLNWVASAEGYTDADSKWIHVGDATLYAYYKQAEITAITYDATTVEPSGTVSFTVTVSPTPVGSTKLCFTVLHSNDNPLAEQPTITYNGGTGKYSFTAPEASGTYKVQAVLRTGSSCDGGDELDTEEANFMVAGLHTVTVRYKCGDDVIKASTTLDGIRPLDWSDAMTAPEIIGYTFSSWTAGDGVTLTDDGGSTTKTTTTAATIKIKAIYDGYLTATYTKKNVIYFNNTLGWEDVYVYFYSSANYWAGTSYGTGACTNQCFGENCWESPYWDGHHGHMTQIEGTNIWYFDYTEEGWGGWANVAFAETNQHTDEAHTDDNAWFRDTKVIRRGDHSTYLPMFVPVANQEPVLYNAVNSYYYDQGCWMNYPENTGYTLKIYNKVSGDPAPVELKSIPFEFTADKSMPMELNVDLEAGKTYGFKIWRNDGQNTGAGSYYGNNSTITANTEGWDMQTGKNNCGLQTTAAGDYKFILSYYAVNSTYHYRVSVTYPVAVGDYRLLYKDNVHTAWHPSAVIPRASAKDTVSFFVRTGQSANLKLQKCTGLGEGSVTWSDTIANWWSSLPAAITQDSVYNICLMHNATNGKLEIENVEAYTGNFYIRVDAANSKWDNYSSDPDHLMTYSEYSIDHGGYSHYYTHWVKADDSRKNIKFVIANDYSPCISDTLTRENNSDPGWENINNYIDEHGNILRNANVRFMWYRHDNTISRAYVDGAQEDGSRFLVISSTDGKIKKADGSALSNNEVTFSDNENWIYEANVQAQPTSEFKLISTWGTSNVITQYFKGGPSSTEILIDGSGSDWYNIRLLYDFKTNRLVAAWVPADQNITVDNPINADVMFIREHQGDIAQLTFGTSGKISKIETAYGVLRFNKWTLNNKDKSTHDPLGEPASIYERSLYWISFPFRVKLSEVFGFGTYGTHWAIQRYDGAARAAQGHFLENGSFWRWMSRNSEYLEPNQGYLLSVDVDLLGEESDVWGPNSKSSQVELYFPSTGTMPDITDADVEQTIEAHTCTINRNLTEGLPDTGDPRTSYNRTIFDSHWNVLSVPTYVNTNDITFANTDWITTKTATSIGPKFLYTWNADDNTITATSGSGYTYHAMHSYMVQYSGNVTWTAKSGSPASIVARKTYEEAPSEVEFRLELQQNDQMIDRTYIVMSNDEEVSANFAFGEDMTKEFNARKAAIFNYTADHVGVAGNTMPMSDQTTVIPIGLDIPTAGEYTFAIPDGTEGVGVTLIDNETGTRTSLSALDYTVNLTAGTHEGRFVLEISPVHGSTTDVEAVMDDGLQVTGARKVIIDQKLFIIKGDKMYDARGAMVK